jgi:hypothetical protein
MNLLSTFVKSVSSFGGSATLASTQLPGRKIYERQVVEEAVRQSSITLNPQGQTRFQNMGYWTDGVATLPRSR